MDASCATGHSRSKSVGRVGLQDCQKRSHFGAGQNLQFHKIHVKRIKLKT